MLYFIVLAGSFLTVVCLFIGLYNLVFVFRLTVLNRLETHTMNPDDMIEAEEVRNRGWETCFISWEFWGKCFPVVLM